MKKKLDSDEALEMKIENLHIENQKFQDNKKLALFKKRYVRSIPWAVNTYHSFNKVFSEGNYTIDQDLIKSLINESAEGVEIYERVK